MFVHNAPASYQHLLQPLPPGVLFEKTLTSQTDIAHIFCDKKADLQAALAAARTRIKPNAAVWVSWPKKVSKVPTDITEDTIRKLALPMGFVDVKVCAVDEVWSGLKLVIRKELR
ncbi:DUF3052 domain-containing protein [Undibacterium sp. TJN25]|uniref:DUF3052 domain-containing protein n=1 Tax=Undibacterium sp. TJN25 TaxID=3413056 RepID=UPI003BF0A45D